MTRITVLGVLAAVGALSLAAVAAQQAPRVITVEKLKDNLFVLKGGGGNSAVLITAAGVVVVDTKNPGWGQPLLDKIRTLTEKPVTMIINTHSHADHVSGNVEFPATVDVVAHENTKLNMAEMRPSFGTPPPAAGQAPPANIFKVHNGKGLPKRTFTDRMTLASGSERIDLYYFGRGHTDGDTWVVFPSLRILHAGDIFSGKTLPLIDATNGGSGVAIAASLQKAHDTIHGVDTIITGHGPQMTWADLAEYAAFNREFLETLRAARKAGKSADDFAGTWTIPAKYKGYDVDSIRVKRTVAATYAELDRADKR